MRRLAAVVTVAVVLLAACAGPGVGPAAGPGDGRVRVDFVAFGDGEEVAGYERMIEAFEQANPDVDVAFAPVAKQDDLLARLTTAFAGGRPPEVFLINYRKYGQFAAQDALEPVQSRLDASDVLREEDFAETALEAFRFDGETLTCLPQNVSSLEVYFNADLFEAAGLERPQAGWTWDDFLTAAEAITEGDTYGVGTEASLIRVAPFVWSNGGEVVDDHTAPTRLTLDQPGSRAALDFFLDLQTEHGVAPPEDQENSLDSQSRFANGKLGMYLDSRKAVPDLRTITDFTWDVAPLPVAPGGEPATILHGDAYCLSAGAEQTDAAWSMVEFANSSEGQTILAESGRTVPSRIDVADSPVFLEPDEPPATSQVFVDAIPTIRSVPHTANWSQVEKEADKILEAMFYGRVDRETGLQQLEQVTTPLFAAGG